jgi:hypothetical protein
LLKATQMVFLKQLFHKDGPQYDLSIRGEAHDDKGNYVQGGAEYNFNSGEGHIGFSGGNKNEEEK